MTLEDFVHELNSLAFFKEFTFAENTFKPAAGGPQLELADNLVWMGDDLTVLQLKERAAGGTEDAEQETRWFEDKVLHKATKQVRDTMTYLDANPAIKVTNAHGHTFELKRADMRAITKIIVYLPGKIVPDIARATRHYVSKTGGFMHVLDARDYLEICRTLRVPADIRDYFAYRQRLLEQVPELDAPEPLIMGQYLSGDETAAPTEASYKFIEALVQNAAEFDLSWVLANIHQRIETQCAPQDYYEILRQFARLPRSGWKAAKMRLDYCLEAVREGKFRAATRFARGDLSVGFVFLPLDPKLAETGNIVELLQRGAMNFTIMHKYDQQLECCVGVAIAKDGDEILITWCALSSPWEYDEELDAKLKEGSPFLEVKAEIIPRYQFNDKTQA